MGVQKIADSKDHAHEFGHYLRGFENLHSGVVLIIREQQSLAFGVLGAGEQGGKREGGRISVKVKRFHVLGGYFEVCFNELGAGTVVVEIRIMAVTDAFDNPSRFQFHKNRGVIGRAGWGQHGGDVQLQRIIAGQIE